MTQPRILLTGGAGYIGIHTAVQLANTGRYNAIVVDRVIPGKLKTAVAGLVKEGTLEFVECDIAKDLEKLKSLDFQGLIHFAALKAVGESVAMPLEYYRNNLNCQLNVLEACKAKNCNVFVFSSSATVYQPNENLLDEDAPLGASNPYGQTKVMGEQILKDYCVAAPQFKAISLRYFNPIGAHPSGTIGEAPENPQNILPIIQRVAIQKLDKVTVMGTDWPTRDGTGVRDYIHVMDLADGHINALDYLTKGASADSGSTADKGCYETFNLGTGKGVSVLEMITTFEKVNGLKIPYVTAPRRPGDLATVVCSPDKAQNVLGFKATRTLEDACSSAWKWQKQNPDGYRA